MPKKAEKKSRNRAREAAEKGRKLVMFEITQEANEILDLAVEDLKKWTGRGSRVQALEQILRDWRDRRG